MDTVAEVLCWGGGKGSEMVLSILFVFCSSITAAVYVVCQNCDKKFRCLDALRAHLGLAKEKGSFVCAPLFAESGCRHCFAFRTNKNETHRYQLFPPLSLSLSSCCYETRRERGESFEMLVFR